MPESSPAPGLDRVAVALSGLCLVHCLALPVALAALPFMSGFAASHWHLPMLGIALPVSVVAIVIGYRRHGNRGIVAGAVLGIALLAAGATVGHAVLGPVADRVLTVTGSLVLAAVHWMNGLRLRRCQE